MNKKDSNFYNCPKIGKFLIICDLDGTLLNDKSELSKETIIGVKKIIKSGHIFCLATGRPYRSSINFYKQLSLNTILINQNGSQICNPSDNLFKPISFNFNNNIFQMIFTNKHIIKLVNNAIIEGANKVWVWKDPTYLYSIEEFVDIFHIDQKQVNILNENPKKLKSDLSSILIHVSNLDNLNQIIYEIKNIAPTLIVRNWSLPKKSDGVIIEINTSFASKDTALDFISSYYGVPIENCISFGDGDNDVGMLHKAIWSFSTKNSSPAARLASRYMTKYTNDENGVVKELIKFLNIK